MSKLVNCILLSLVLVFSTSTPVLAQGATLLLTPASGTFNRGCTFSVDIRVDTGSVQTDGTDAIVIYDNTRLKVTDIKKGTIYPLEGVSNIEEAKGIVSYSGLADVAAPFTGSGVVATLNFQVQEDAPAGATKVEFDFDPNDKAKTTDSNVVQRGEVVDVLSSATGANYVIGSGSCSESETVTVTPPPATGGELKPGGTGETIITPIPTKTLPAAGDFQTTAILVLASGTLIVLGFLGLMLR